MADYAEDQVPSWMNRFSPADITPAEFERFIAEAYGVLEPIVDDLRVQLHDRVEGTDGSFVFDATVRFRFAGAEYLTLVEAKRHKNPIKREMVQALHSKALSVGAHKAVMISTAPFQKGALDFALVHGIALVTMTEGRFTYETRAVGPSPVLTREEAAERWGLPTFVGQCYSAGESSGAIRSTVISPEHPEYIRELLAPEPDGGWPRTQSPEGQP